MAYADDLRQAVFNPSTAADLIEGVLIGTYYDSKTSTDSTTVSSAISDVPNLSITLTKEADQIVLISGQFGLSCSSTNQVFSAIARRGTTSLSEQSFGTYRTTAGTGGRELLCTCVGLDTSTTTGSVTYYLSYFQQGVTYYTREAYMQALVYRVE